MASKDSISATLGALAILSEAATSIHATNLQVEENVRDRRFKEEQANKSREHQFALMDAEHENKKDLTQDAWKRDLDVQYPGLEWVNGQPDLASYDLTKSQAIRENKISVVTQSLLDSGLSTEGTDKELMQRNKIYQLGKSYGMSASGGMVSPDVTFAQGGDASPYMMTSHDLNDFNVFFNNSLMLDNNKHIVDSMGNETPNPEYNREVLSPIGIMTLNGMNLIPQEIEIKSDANGMQYISSQDTQQLKNILKGIQAGVEQNKNYMNNAEYSTFQDVQRDKQVKYAGELAGSPAVALASREFDASKTNYVGMIGYTNVSGTPAMNWGGELVEVEEVYDLVDDFADSNPQFEGIRARHVEKVLSISMNPSPEALFGVVDYLQGMPSDQAQQVIDDLSAIEGGNQAMAESISDAFNRYKKITAVANKTASYIDDPVSLETMMGVKGDMQNLGIYSDVVALRELELQGVPNDDPRAIALVGRYAKNIKQIKGAYKDAISKAKTPEQKEDAEKKLNELEEWLDLERVTFDLRKSVGFKSI